MSLTTKTTTNDNNGVNSLYLSSNHKVIHYLQNSTRCSMNDSNKNTTNNSLNGIHKTSSHTHDLFNVKDTSMNNNNNNNDHIQSQNRTRSCSEAGSTSSVNDTLSRSDFSLGSSLSDPGGHCSIFSSNTSSSGICSTFSDVGQEEGTSTSSEELDFNLGFDQISDNDDDIEVANLDEIDEDDEHEQNDGDNQQVSNKNSDTGTLLDGGESNLDARISELEEILRKSYSSTIIDDDDYEFTNDDTITADQTKQQPRASFLHSPTYTLCSQDRFSAYTEDDDHDNEQMINGIGIRSNSWGIVQLDGKTALLDKAPKKVVRFADMLGLDLESIRYMTPPDQSTTSLIQECIRIKLEQLRLAKSQSSLSSSSSSPFDLATTRNRSSSSSSLSVSTKPTNQYYFVSKYFTSPSDIIPLIYERQVLFECLYTNDSIAYGTVRVHNCAYDKHVFVRLTENEWETFQDIHAYHSMNYPNDNTDTFTFEIRLGKYNDITKVPKYIYFAVCLKAMSQEFWDNNHGWNYILHVLERR